MLRHMLNPLAYVLWIALDSQKGRNGIRSKIWF